MEGRHPFITNSLYTFFVLIQLIQIMAAKSSNQEIVYEEFEPYCKWQRKEDRDILEIQLQGKYIHMWANFLHLFVF